MPVSLLQMTILDCYAYIQDRLNKLGSNTYDNIPKHQFVRAFNAVQDQWVEERIKLDDTNSIRINELQQITVPLNIVPSKVENYSYFPLPEDFYHKKRVICYLPCPVYAYQVKETDVNRYLSDEFWKPSVDWEETFWTIMDNKVRIYGDFNIPNVEFIYYRKPRQVNMADGFNDLNGEPTVDIDPEFQNASLIEILNETAMLLSSDIGDQFRFQTMGQKVVQHT